MKKIGVIINKNAKKNRGLKNPGKNYETISSDKIILKVTSYIEEMTKAIEDFREESVSYIAISGGDGTIHRVLSKAIEIYNKDEVPPIVILKGGTMDNISRSIRLKGKGLSVLNRLIEQLDEGIEPVITERDTMKVGDKYCFLFGFGFVSSFLDEVYSGNKGFVQNVKVISKAVKQVAFPPKENSMFATLKADVILDGETLEFDDISGSLIGTVEHVGMGFSPLFLGNKEDGKFHVIISGLSPIMFFKNILKLKNGKSKFENPLFISATKRKMIVSCEVPFRYTMDGEMYDCDGSLVMETGPRVKFVVV